MEKGEKPQIVKGGGSPLARPYGESKMADELRAGKQISNRPRAGLGRALIGKLAPDRQNLAGRMLVN